MVICGYNPVINKTILFCFILVCKENETTFSKIFKYLYDKFNFNYQNIIVDFNLSQIKGLIKTLTLFSIFQR